MMYLQRDMAIFMYYLLFSSRLPIPAAGTARRSGKTTDIPAPCHIMPQPIENVVPECYPGGLARTVVPGVWPVSLFSLLRHASIFALGCHAPAGICIFPFRFPFACKIIKTSHSLPPPPRLPPNRPPPPVSSSGDARAVPAGLPCISSCRR